MGKPPAQKQEEYRERINQGVRMIKTPVGYDLLDHLQNAGYLPSGIALDWPTVSKEQVEGALRRYLEDQAS